MEPGAPRRGREIRQAHARRQIRRVEEPRRPDRQTVRGVREPAGHGPQGPAPPFMAAQGTPPDAAQATGRPGPGRTEPLGVPGVPQPHPRDRRTRPGRPAVMGPTSSGQSNWAVQTPGSRRPTTGSRPPSAWPTDSTTSPTSSPWSCSDAADPTYAHHNQEPNPRKQQKPQFCIGPRQQYHHRGMKSHGARRRISSKTKSAAKPQSA